MKLDIAERSEGEGREPEADEIVLAVREGGTDAEVRLSPDGAGGLAAVLRAVADGLDPAGGDGPGGVGSGSDRPDGDRSDRDRAGAGRAGGEEVATEPVGPDARDAGEASGRPTVRLIVRRTAAATPRPVPLRSADEVDRRELEAMCHELRTPINALVGYAALLDERVYGELGEEQAEAVRRIRSASDRLLGALRHLFERAGIDLGDFYPRVRERSANGSEERPRPPLRRHEG